MRKHTNNRRDTMFTIQRQMADCTSLFPEILQLSHCKSIFCTCLKHLFSVNSRGISSLQISNRLISNLTPYLAIFYV